MIIHRKPYFFLNIQSFGTFNIGNANFSRSTLPMLIYSCNVNGLRASIKNGFLDFLNEKNPDIVLLQEIKAEASHFAPLEALGYHCYCFPAAKKGYSGVAIISKQPATTVIYGCAIDTWDQEGRIIRAEFSSETGPIQVMSVYLPSGTSGDERQQIKYQMLDFFLPYTQMLQAESPRMLIGGDFNICHQDIDIHNPKSNAKSSGFLPEERAWMSKFLSADAGLDGKFVDIFRKLYPTEVGRYSWWSRRFKTVKEQNKGWRIDYIVVAPSLLPHTKDAYIEPQYNLSDHCPVGILLF